MTGKKLLANGPRTPLTCCFFARWMGWLKCGYHELETWSVRHWRVGREVSDASELWNWPNGPTCSSAPQADDKAGGPPGRGIWPAHDSDWSAGSPSQQTRGWSTAGPHWWCGSGPECRFRPRQGSLSLYIFLFSFFPVFFFLFYHFSYFKYSLNTQLNAQSTKKAPHAMHGWFYLYTNYSFSQMPHMQPLENRNGYLNNINSSCRTFIKRCCF